MSGRGCSASNASTSARVGQPEAPPIRVHLMPATAAPKRIAAVTPWPSVSADQETAMERVAGAKRIDGG